MEGVGTYPTPCLPPGSAPSHSVGAQGVDGGPGTPRWSQEGWPQCPGGKAPRTPPQLTSLSAQPFPTQGPYPTTPRRPCPPDVHSGAGELLTSAHNIPPDGGLSLPTLTSTHLSFQAPG